MNQKFAKTRIFWSIFQKRKLWIQSKINVRLLLLIGLSSNINCKSKYINGLNLSNWTLAHFREKKNKQKKATNADMQTINKLSIICWYYTKVKYYNVSLCFFISEIYYCFACEQLWQLRCNISLLLWYEFTAKKKREQIRMVKVNNADTLRLGLTNR